LRGSGQLSGSIIQRSAFSYQQSAVDFAFSQQMKGNTNVRDVPTSPAEETGCKLRGFRQLKVWQKAHSLAVDVYTSTRTFPKAELYGLTSQIRRSGTSIPANIAEGCCRESSAEFARFLHIAVGSASELEYHFLLANDLKLLEDVDHKRLTSNVLEIRKMLTSFIQKLKADR
jgi:four helix bundle protein